MAVKKMYLCPFCSEHSRPIPGKVLRDDHQMWTQWECEAGHTFYCYEKVCKDQSWADEKFNDPNVIAKDKLWRKRLRADR